MKRCRGKTKPFFGLNGIFPITLWISTIVLGWGGGGAPVLSTDTIEVYDSCDVHDALNSTYENLVSAIEDFQQPGPGWILDKLIALDLHLLELDPLRATSYIPLATCIQNRKAVISIKNKDEKCYLWSVIAGLYGDYHAKNHERVFRYLEYEKEFNLQGVKGYSKIRKIE